MPDIVLSEVESRRYLEKSGISMNRFVFVPGRDELIELTRTLRFPLVMKLISPKAVHKSDIGGVLLDIANENELLTGWDTLFANAAAHGIRPEDIEGINVQEQIRGVGEILIGLKRDATFGPVLVLGSGGILVELLKDVALGICPLNDNDIDRMLRKIKGSRLLEGYRGKTKGDMDALRVLIKTVSDMAMDMDDWQEIDLNPVLVGPEGQGAFAVDARVVIRRKNG